MTPTQSEKYAKLLAWCIGGVDGSNVLIGSEAVGVDGRTAGGDTIPLMRSGRFV